MQNAHLESCGPIGRGWVLRKFTAAVTDPQYIPIIAYPNAWSPSTKGVVTSEVVLFTAKTEAEFAKYKGQLAGKIILTTGERPIRPLDKALLSRYSDEELAKMASAAPPSDSSSSGLPPADIIKRFVDGFNQDVKRTKFLQEEGAVVTLYSSGEGSGGTSFVQGASVAVEMPTEIKSINDIFDSPAFQPQNKKYGANMLPQVTVASEDYNRMVRMINNGAKPKMTIEVDAQYSEDDPMQYNTIAEIPGTDPVLKEEVVMLGAPWFAFQNARFAAPQNADGELRDAGILEMQYIANEGFLISSRDKRVLIDGLHRPYLKEYASLPEDEREKIESAQTPFDGVDLILVSHLHGDHFHPESVGRYLTNSSKTIFASSQQVVDEMAVKFASFDSIKPRVTGIPFQLRSRQSMKLAGIDVEFLSIGHGSGQSASIQNLGHIIHIGGKKVLHVGDAVVMPEIFDAFDLEKQGIDIALLPSWLLTNKGGQELVNKHIDPKQIIAIHVEPNRTDEVRREMARYFPDAKLFSSMLEKQCF